MRKPRELVNGASYHVVARANRKEMIFLTPGIKEMFLHQVKIAQKRYQFTIKNFCIMGNHFHFIIKPLKDENLSDIMQWILSVFARNYNRRQNLVGHVWYDRFRSKVIRSFHQYLLTFLYISNNPVRAGISKRAIDYEYNGISFLKNGYISILERPPNAFLNIIWTQLRIDK